MRRENSHCRVMLVLKQFHSSQMVPNPGLPSGKLCSGSLCVVPSELTKNKMLQRQDDCLSHNNKRLNQGKAAVMSVFCDWNPLKTTLSVVSWPKGTESCYTLFSQRCLQRVRNPEAHLQHGGVSKWQTLKREVIISEQKLGF